jgi:hypothetical protein
MDGKYQEKDFYRGDPSRNSKMIGVVTWKTAGIFPTQASHKDLLGLTTS